MSSLGVVTSPTSLWPWVSDSAGSGGSFERGDHGRHERHACRFRRARRVEDLDRAAAVGSLHLGRAGGEAGLQRVLDGLGSLDGLSADGPAEELLERRAENLAGCGVGGDIAPLVVPDEKSDARGLERL